MNQRFHSSLGIPLDVRGVIGEILTFMRAVPMRAYKIIIGTDSQKGARITDFVTAIVVYRVGNGGRYFWRRLDYARPFHTLRDRILEEVMLSLDVAKELLGTLKNFDVPSFDFEIHVDVGEHGETKAMLQELVGMIRANNFDVRTKPESYAASKVADRHV